MQPVKKSCKFTLLTPITIVAARMSNDPEQLLEIIRKPPLRVLDVGTVVEVEVIKVFDVMGLRTYVLEIVVESETDIGTWAPNLKIFYDATGCDLPKMDLPESIWILPGRSSVDDMLMPPYQISANPPTKVSIFAIIVMIIVTGVLSYVIATAGTF